LNEFIRLVIFSQDCLGAPLPHPYLGAPQLDNINIVKEPNVTATNAILIKVYLFILNVFYCLNFLGYHTPQLLLELPSITYLLHDDNSNTSPNANNVVFFIINNLMIK